MKHQIGLIGHPVSHSKSPEIFQEFFSLTPYQHWGYTLWDLPKIQEITVIINTPDIRGFNVTLPHKTNIIPYLDFISADAYHMKSVNTVIRIPATAEALHQLRFQLENLELNLLELNAEILRPLEIGHFSEKKLTAEIDIFRAHYLIGFNTDIMGFEDSVNSIDQQFNQAIIIGNGGSSKSVKQLLVNKEIPFLQFSRTPNSKDSVLGMEELVHRKPMPNTLWINTSPAGMSPNCDNMPYIPEKSVHPTDALIDLIYNPLETKLMKHFQQQGAKTLNGWIMLTSQAKHAWKLFQIAAELS